MKAAITVLLLVLSAAVGGAYADDGGGTAPPSHKIMKQRPAPAPAKHTAPATIAKPAPRPR